MVWYWWIAICVYFNIGMYLGGAWFSEKGEDLFHFLVSITLIGMFWPITLLTVFVYEWRKEIWDFMRIGSIIQRYKDHRREKMNNEDYDNMRLERMGADEEIWKV